MELRPDSGRVGMTIHECHYVGCSSSRFQQPPMDKSVGMFLRFLGHAIDQQNSAKKEQFASPYNTFAFAAVLFRGRFGLKVFASRSCHGWGKVIRTGELERFGAARSNVTYSAY